MKPSSPPARSRSSTAGSTSLTWMCVISSPYSRSAATGSPPPTMKWPTSRQMPAPVPCSRPASSSTSSGASMNVAVCGWKLTLHPVRRGGRQLAQQRGKLVERARRPAGRALRHPAAPPVPYAAAIQRHVEHLPVRRDQPAEVAPRDVAGAARQPIDVRVDRGVELGEPQAAPCQLGVRAPRPPGSRGRAGTFVPRAPRRRRGSPRTEPPVPGRAGRRCSTRSARSRSAPKRGSSRLLLEPAAELLLVRGPALRHRDVPPAGLVGTGDLSSRSTRTWTSDGPPEASARSTAGRTSAAAAASSVWTPNARPMAAKSGE